MVELVPDTISKLASFSEHDGTLGRRVYLAIRDAIMDLRYAPGEIIRKQDICTALGVSRSPVAEALTRLQGEGLVDIVPQSGTYVSYFSMEEIKEGAFLREAIELACVEKVAENITPEQSAQLTRNLRLQRVMIDECDYPGFYELDREMHAMIIDFTGFRQLSGVAKMGWVHVERARRLVLPVQGRVADTYDEHDRIVQAIIAKDPALARATLRAHLRQLMSVLIPLQREHPEFFNQST